MRLNKRQLIILQFTSTTLTKCFHRPGPHSVRELSFINDTDHNFNNNELTLRRRMKLLLERSHCIGSFASATEETTFRQSWIEKGQEVLKTTHYKRSKTMSQQILHPRVSSVTEIVLLPCRSDLLWRNKVQST